MARSISGKDIVVCYQYSKSGENPETIFCNPGPHSSIVRGTQAAYIEAMKRFVFHVLIAILVLAGVLASPAVMAWTMPAESAASDCTLCLAGSQQQHSPATASTCAAAACGMMASMAADGIRPGPALRIIPTFHVEAHPGRRLEGPDPFPPRVIRV